MKKWILCMLLLIVFMRNGDTIEIPDAKSIKYETKWFPFITYVTISDQQGRALFVADKKDVMYITSQ